MVKLTQVNDLVSTDRSFIRIGLSAAWQGKHMRIALERTRSFNQEGWTWDQWLLADVKSYTNVFPTVCSRHAVFRIQLRYSYTLDYPTMSFHELLRFSICRTIALDVLHIAV